MLNLIVVEGEGAINNIRQRTAREAIRCRRSSGSHARWWGWRLLARGLHHDCCRDRHSWTPIGYFHDIS